MGIAQDILADWHAAQAALLWQVDLGVDEWLLDTPLNRYDLPETVRVTVAPPAAAASAAAPAAQVARGIAPPPMPEAPKVDCVALAKAAAARAQTLDALRDALAGFEHCDLKRGARNLVFCDGVVGARVLVLVDSPDVDEDREGRPCVGRAGALLDAMFAAIGLSRQAERPEAGIYLCPVVPWRVVGNGGDPLPEELEMMRPFVERHIDLAGPDVVVAMGNLALSAITGAAGIARARGQWGQAMGRPLLPMLHPQALLRNPGAKREAWADLLALEARLAQ